MTKSPLTTEVYISDKQFIIEPYKHKEETRVRLYRVQKVVLEGIEPFNIPQQVFHPDLDRTFKNQADCQLWIKDWLKENYHRF